MINTILELANIYYKYPRMSHWNLYNINLKIKRGSLVILAGPTGSGKSTLLKIIRGLNHEYGGDNLGDIFFDGEKINNVLAASLGSKIAILFQNPAYQLTQPRVIDEIISPLLYQGLYWEECLHKVEEIIKYMKLEYCLNQNSSDLSLGMQQKVALTAALVMKAELILLDEPFSYLDAKGINEFVTLIKYLKNQGKTIIIAAHDLEPIASLADRIIILNNGKIIYKGIPQKVLYSKDFASVLGRPLFIELGDLFFRRRVIKERIISYKEIDKLILSSNIKIESVIHKTPEEMDRVAIDFKHVSFSYPNGFRAIQDISFQVNKGDIFGIIGSNSCGKSTLARLLVGSLKPSIGSIKVFNKPAGHKSIMGGKVGYVTQNPSEMLFETTVEKECSIGPILLDLPNVKEHVHNTLSSYGLTDLLERDPHSLSGGEQRLLSLADVIVNDPELLILDEPEFGLDKKTYTKVKELINGFYSLKRTIVLITHNIETILFLCNRIAVLKDGKFLNVGSKNEILSDRNLIEEAGLIYSPFYRTCNLPFRDHGKILSDKKFSEFIYERWRKARYHD